MKNLHIIDETRFGHEMHLGVTFTDSQNKLRAAWIPSHLIATLTQPNTEELIAMIEDFASALRAWEEVKRFREMTREAQSINEGLKAQYSNEKQ